MATPAETFAHHAPQPHPGPPSGQLTSVTPSTTGGLKTTFRYALAISLPAMTTAMAAIAATTAGQARLYWIVGTIACTLGVGLLAVFKEVGVGRTQLETASMRLKLRTALAEASQPLITALGRVSAARGVAGKRNEIGTLIDRAVSVMRGQCGSGRRREDYRSIFYAFEGDRLVRKAWEGRQGTTAAPRASFDPNDPDPTRRHDAHYVIQIARGEEPFLIEDLHDNPPGFITNPRQRSYRTLLAAPVSAGGLSYGLLCIDSPEARTFADIDRRNIMLIAGVLAAGLAQLGAS